jgi:hypothetical protein
VLSGAVLSIAAPSTAILAGVVLTLVLTVVSALGERRLHARVTAERPARHQPAAVARKVRR